jgi:hypothetical protein
MKDVADYPLVYVEWEDSLAGTTGWGFIDGVKPTIMVCRSVGWLVYDGEDCKLIVSHLSEPDHADAKQQGCGDMTIPTSAIRKIVTVKIKSR